MIQQPKTHQMDNQIRRQQLGLLHVLPVTEFKLLVLFEKYYVEGVGCYLSSVLQIQLIGH